MRYPVYNRTALIKICCTVVKNVLQNEQFVEIKTDEQIKNFVLDIIDNCK